MNTPALPNKSDAPSEPTGQVQPKMERALRAVAALRDGRLADAEKHIAAIEESSAIDRAWKRYLEGRLMSARGGFESAEAPLRQAAALAVELGLSLPHDAGERNGDACEGTLNAGAFRLAAAAYEALGLALRRQDRPAEAYSAHLIAGRLREEHGTFEEQWESAISLGLSAELARDAQKSEMWFRKALAIAERTTEKPAEKGAIAWTHLSALLADSARYEEAVAAARAARDLWLKHDSGALEAVRADVHLAHTLIRLCEALVGTGASQAGDAARKAISLLEPAGEALSAFGPRAADDSARCNELVDFAHRLLATCQG